MKKYDILASKAIGDNVTAMEIKAGKDLSIFGDERAAEAMWIEFQTREVEITEGIYTCKCGSKKVYTAKKQTRSADEAMTFYVRCIEPKCGRIWTI